MPNENQPATIDTVQDGQTHAVPLPPADPPADHQATDEHGDVVENVPPANVTAAAPEFGQPTGSTDVVTAQPTPPLAVNDPLAPLPPGHPALPPPAGTAPGTTGSDVPQAEAANSQMPAHVPLPARDPLAVTQPAAVDPGAVGAQTQGDPVMAAALDRLRLVIQEARVAVRQFPYDVGGEIGAFVSFMREKF